MTREEAIEVLEQDLSCEFDKDLIEALDMAIKALEERKTGKWILSYGNVKCSVCGKVYDCREVGKATHYCPYCGAKMEGAEE